MHWHKLFFEALSRLLGGKGRDRTHARPYRTPAEAAALTARCPVAGTVWQHVRSGRTCRVTARCLLEDDVRPAVAYEHEGEGFSWVRPLPDFLAKFRPWPVGPTPPAGGKP